MTAPPVCLTSDGLFALGSGLLSAGSLEALDAHLDECERCMRLVADLARAETSEPGRVRMVPTTHGRFRVEALVGQGAMGRVYAAHDPQLNRRVALKVLRDFEDRPRLLQEARALARLSHPNIVTVHEIGYVDDSPFLAMELVEGQTLRAWLAERERPWTQVVTCFIQAGRGLSAAHEAGIVHRDFKPDNVLVASDGSVRVTDFGLATPTERAPERPPSESWSTSSLAPQVSTAAGHVMGTPAYLAPERRAGRPADAHSDQYSFCVSLHEALTGRRPEEPPRPMERFAPPRPLPRPLRKLLARGLQPDAAARFHSMEELLRHLERSLASPRLRRRVLAVTLALISSVSVPTVVISSRSARPRCEDGAPLVEGLWTQSRRDALRGVLSGGAPRRAHLEDMWPRLDEAVRRFQSAWALQHAETCRATLVDGHQSHRAMELRMSCLQHQRMQMDILLALLERGDEAVLTKTMDAVGALSSLSPCADVASLEPASLPTLPRSDEPRADLARASVLHRVGRLQEAEVTAGRVVERAARRARRALEAEARVLLGELQLDQGRFQDALSTLTEALLAAEATGHSAATVTARVLLAQLEMRRGRPRADALLQLRHARAALERLGGRRDLEATLSFLEGTLAAMFGDAAGAQERFERALAVSEGTALHARVLGHQGLLARTQGRLTDAERLMKRGLAEQTALLGPRHPRLARDLMSLGQVYELSGRSTEARHALEHALSIQEASVGAHHPDVAMTLGTLAVHAAGARDFARATELLTRALVIQEQHLDPESPAVAMTLANLGAVALESARPREALRHLERAIAILERAHGADHPELIPKWINLGAALLTLHQPRRALAAFERARALRAEKQPDHPQRVHELVGIGRALLALDRPREALAPLEEADALLRLEPANGGGDPGLRTRARQALRRARARARALPAAAIGRAEG